MGSERLAWLLLFLLYNVMKTPCSLAKVFFPNTVTAMMPALLHWAQRQGDVRRTQGLGFQSEDMSSEPGSPNLLEVVPTHPNTHSVHLPIFGVYVPTYSVYLFTVSTPPPPPSYINQLQKDLFLKETDILWEEAYCVFELSRVQTQATPSIIVCCHHASWYHAVLAWTTLWSKSREWKRS